MAERVTIELEGLMLERLLNIALSEGAEFAHAVRLTRRRISVTCPPRSAFILRKLAGKYRIGCTTAGMQGLCALMSRARQRITIVAAVASAICLSALFLSRIWIVDIDLKRSDALPEGAHNVLQGAGIVSGRSASAADTALAAAQLAALEGCSHASVIRDGVAMRVEIVCEMPAPGVYEIGSARDLVALCDGVVSSVTVKNGTAMVAPGDTVRRGQVLISGYERESSESMRDLGALGSVTARVWYSGDAGASMSATSERYTGRTGTEATLCTPWFEIPLLTCAEYENSTAEEERIPVCTLFFPLYIRRTVFAEYEPADVQFDIDELKSAVGAAALAAAHAQMQQNAPENAEIIDHWTDFGIIESDILNARAVIEAEAEIAVTRGYLEGY